MERIDITMAATLRPAILEQTLLSIVEKVCKNNTDRFNLIINVDPAGEDIPQSGRIAALADVFDALTSERPYKKAWTVEAAVDLIKETSGQHFDPALVDVFLQQLDAIQEIRNRFDEPEAT